MWYVLYTLVKHVTQIINIYFRSHRFVSQTSIYIFTYNTEETIKAPLHPEKCTVRSGVQAEDIIGH